jgi:hypothetical protein
MWCFKPTPTESGTRCVSGDSCTGSNSQGGTQLFCSSASVTVALAACPNNCSGNGICQNGTVCQCSGDFYGADCATAGLSAFVKGLAISGGALSYPSTDLQLAWCLFFLGVIAAIVIVGAVIFVAVVIGTKKAVDWAMLNNIASSNVHDNPTFVDTNAEKNNPAFSMSPGRDTWSSSYQMNMYP